MRPFTVRVPSGTVKRVSGLKEPDFRAGFMRRPVCYGCTLPEVDIDDLGGDSKTDMVTFTSLFLWLITHVHPVTVAVDPAVVEMVGLAEEHSSQES